MLKKNKYPNSKIENVIRNLNIHYFVKGKIITNIVAHSAILLEELEN